MSEVEHSNHSCFVGWEKARLRVQVRHRSFHTAWTTHNGLSGRLPEHALSRIAKGDGLFLESFTELAYRRSHALPSTARLSLSMADFLRYDQALS